MSRKMGLSPAYDIGGEGVRWDLGADGVRLPTEAEWEYSARGGSQSQGYIYSGSNNLGEVAWWLENSGRKSHPVGQKKANELGIHDMSGNVYEWCWDYSDYYQADSQVDPRGPLQGERRIIRGGYWSAVAGGADIDEKGFLLTASRSNDLPESNRYNQIGFRIARTK